MEIYLQDSPIYLLRSIEFKEISHRLLLRMVLWINCPFSKLELEASQREWIHNQVWYLVLSNKRDNAVFPILSTISAITTIKRLPWIIAIQIFTFLHFLISQFKMVWLLFQIQFKITFCLFSIHLRQWMLRLIKTAITKMQKHLQ